MLLAKLVFLADLLMLAVLLMMAVLQLLTSLLFTVLRLQLGYLLFPLKFLSKKYSIMLAS
jgi:hypothetical protein